MADVDEAEIRGLQEGVRGHVIRPRGADYDDARRVFNAIIDRHPALILRCANESDVIAGVNFARERGLLVAVRGGGHNVMGYGVCDDGLVIDLSEMKRVDVEPKRRVARAQGGATWGDFDRATQAVGLAGTGGIVPSTGVGGLTLGGGFGYLVRKHGLACDNLLSADVVTADGERLRAAPDENDDLFWGLRGGGGNLGVVTSLEYRVHPLGPVLGGEIVYPLEQAREVLRFFGDWAADAPDELRVDPTLASGPDGPALSVSVCYCGSIAEGEKLIEPLRKIGSPIADSVAPTSYEVVQNLFTEIFPPGMRHYWKSGYLDALGSDAVDAVVDYFRADVPAPLSIITFEHLGGAINRVPVGETAFGQRSALHTFLVLRAWHDPAEDDENIAWGRAAYDVGEPFLQGGVYVNYLGGDDDMRRRAAYGPNYERLAAVKAKYDPTNFFRVNQNIEPAQLVQPSGA